MDICPICGKEDWLTMHHVVPKRHGGTRWEVNMFPVCRCCHSIIDRMYSAPSRMDYVKIVCKMFSYMHNKYPKHYPYNIVTLYMFLYYGIEQYELNLYHIIEHVEEYKGNKYYLFVKLRRLNQQLPKSQQIDFSYDFKRNKIIINCVVLRQMDAHDYRYKQSYTYNRK